MHPSFRRALSRAVIVVAVAGGALVVTTGPSAAEPTTPQVGECHDLTWKQALQPSDTAAAVPCDQEHTTQTVAIKHYDNPKWNDVGWLIRKASPACLRGATAAVGSSKIMSMSAYEFFFFVPTKAEREEGADWLRCDLGIEARKQLIQLPETLKPRRLPLANRYLKCINRRNDYVPCSQPHRFRAKASVTLAGSYPSKARAAKAAGKCRPKVGARFTYSYPTRVQWKVGYRTLVCFQVTNLY